MEANYLCQLLVSKDIIAFGKKLRSVGLSVDSSRLAEMEPVWIFHDRYRIGPEGSTDRSTDLSFLPKAILSLGTNN